MRIGIAGWFGSDNVGDELLLSTTLRLLPPDADVTVFGADPDRVTEVHGVRTLPLAGSGAVAKVRAMAGWYRELRKLDVLLIGPGTVFQERSPALRWPGTLPLFLRMCAVARAAGVPVVVFGAGVREDTTRVGRAALRLIGHSSVAVGTRDAVSASLLRGDAEVIGDVASAWVPPSASGRDLQRFAVALRPLSHVAEYQVVGAVTEVVTSLNGAGLVGEFLAFGGGRGANGECDREIWSRYFGHLLREVEVPLIEATSGPWTARLGGYAVVVAARLHAAVVSLHLATPTVAIAYERKVAGVMEHLGLGAFVWTPGMPARTLGAMVERALADDAPFIAARDQLSREAGEVEGFLRRSLAAVPS